MSRFQLISTERVAERAVLMGVDTRDGLWPTERSLDELERLADTAGAVVVARLTQRLDRPSPKTYIGSGKVEELRGFVQRLDADVVIFDDDLSPSQQSNLERALGEPIKIIDRTALILDIFGLHARTREGRLQVQLAQLQYLLPRLRGMWTHLAKEQTRGGIGSRFGQGESQLEVDRRMIRNRIASLRKELAMVERRRAVQSKSRTGSLAFRIALAGYTNAGKSKIEPAQPLDRIGRPCPRQAVRNARSDHALLRAARRSRHHDNRYRGVYPKASPWAGRGVQIDPV